MSAKPEVRSFVRDFASAPTLGDLPQVVDVHNAAPPNPPAETQQQFVGSVYAAAYIEAETFVDRALRDWPSGSRGSQVVMDFGAGWGRITRMLLRSFSPVQIWTSDVDSKMTALVHSTLPGVNAVTNSTMPPSAFRSSMFDSITAFSVFSHLSESAHRAWANEFSRVTRVGGKVYLTVLEEDLFVAAAGAQAAVSSGDANAFASGLAMVFSDPEDSMKRYKAGQFIYGAGGEDGPRDEDSYGWAAAPRAWMERVWGDAGFSLESWTPTGELFDQAMVVLVRGDGDPTHLYRRLRRVGWRVKRRLTMRR